MVLGGMTLASIRSIRLVALALLLSLSSITAEAKKHLDRDELQVLSATSVAVVYVDMDQPLQPYIVEGGSINVAAQLVADAVAQHQMNEYLARVAPYRGVIDKLALPQATRKGVQEALASVPALQKMPWTVTMPDPNDNFFMRDQALKTKAQVVIFIRPKLMMNPNADHFYIVSSIDIETLDANGKSFDHYDGTQLTASVDVDDDQLPPLATPPAPGMKDEDVRAARLFANDGAAFMQVYSSLLQQAQQKLYYFFTGSNTPPPAAATHAG